MTSIREALRRLITPALPLEPGNYAYTAPPDSELPYRLHLRVDEKGEGVLIVNAATILHLNQTAAEYAYHMVKNNPPETAAERVATRYNISKQQALNDFEVISDCLNTFPTCIIFVGQLSTTSGEPTR
ncbi:MAG: hypothetical protein ACK2UW_24435 [Anaerolineales bacterium]